MTMAHASKTLKMRVDRTTTDYAGKRVFRQEWGRGVRTEEFFTGIDKALREGKTLRVRGLSRGLGFGFRQFRTEVRILDSEGRLGLEVERLDPKHALIAASRSYQRYLDIDGSRDDSSHVPLSKADNALFSWITGGNIVLVRMTEGKVIAELRNKEDKIIASVCSDNFQSVYRSLNHLIDRKGYNAQYHSELPPATAWLS